jgi:hypothetical protein
MFVSYRSDRRDRWIRRQRLQRNWLLIQPFLYRLERIVHITRTVLLVWLLLDWTYQIGVQLSNFSLLGLVLVYVFFKLTWPYWLKPTTP